LFLKQVIYTAAKKKNIMDHQSWGYNVIQTRGVKSSGGGSEKLGTQSITKGKDVETVKKTSGTNTKSGVPQNIGKLMNTEEFKVDTVSHDFKIALQQARQAKKLNQKQLAELVNEKQSVISEYESGKAIPNPQVISKLERALGCKLPRQKKKKSKKVDGLEDDWEILNSWITNLTVFVVSTKISHSKLLTTESLAFILNLTQSKTK